MKIGKALQDLRKSKKIKQYVAAQGIGITQTYLSQIEAGRKNASTEVIQKMGDYYDVPMAIILWKAIDISDVSADKQNIFEQLKPAIDGLINEVF